MRTRKIVKTVQHLLAWLGAATAFTAQSETFPLTGKVVDAEARPVAGAVVERCEYAETLSGESWEMESRERTTTDATGTFELRATRTMMLLLARKPGLAPAWREFMATPGTRPRLTLTPPTVLAGVVVDESNRPVAGAQVSVTTACSETTDEEGRREQHTLSSQLAQECFSARTSAAGRFRITGFPTNAAAELTVLAPGKTRNPSKELEHGRFGYYGPGMLEFCAGKEDIRLVMEPAGSIEGKVIAEPGSPPLPKARLRLRPYDYAPGVYGPVVFSLMQRGPVEAEADGSFRITDVPAGSYHFLVTFGTNAVPDWVAAEVLVSVKSGQVTRGVEIPATRGGLLAVTMRGSADRKPVAEASVSVYGDDSYATAYSGSNGIVLLRLPSGEYKVSVSNEDWQSEASTASVDTGQTNHIEIELAPMPKTSGVVRRPDGQPAAGLDVQVVSDDEGSLLYTQIVTDADGRFEFRWPSVWPQSTRCLLIRDVERNLAVAVDIDEDTGPLDLRLAPALTLAGRAECDGKPVTNAWAAPIFGTGNRAIYLTGLNSDPNTPGHFEIPALPLGRRYGVAVSAPGYGLKSLHNLKISADPGRQELDPVELKPDNLRVAGQVVDADDQPVAGVRVDLDCADESSVWMHADHEGRFLFTKVCEGPAQLYAHARNSIDGGITAEGGETNVVLRLGEFDSRDPGDIVRRLKGTVTDPEGKPVVGARVSVFPTGSTHWARTGTNGTFEFKWSFTPATPGMRLLDSRANLVVLAAARNLAALEEIADNTTNLNVRLKPALTLTGRVEGPDGQALTNAEVGCRLASGDGGHQVIDQLTSTDAKGRFEVKALPARAQYTVFAKAKGHGRSQREIETDTETNRVELEPFVLQVADQVVAGRVLNEKNRPLAGVHVGMYGEDQPEGSTTTDGQGRFSLQVCEGPLELRVSTRNGDVDATVEAGDTNVVLQFARDEPFVQPAARVTSSLNGKALPDLTPLGLAADAAPSGKPVLLCLLDVEQRPSRRMARLLAEQHDALRRKGLTLLAAQASVTGTDAFKEWQAANPVPFPIGRVSEQSEKTRWATDQASFPWLILTDGGGRVVAEGFALDELDAKLRLTGK